MCVAWALTPGFEMIVGGTVACIFLKVKGDIDCDQVVAVLCFEFVPRP